MFSHTYSHSIRYETIQQDPERNYLKFHLKRDFDLIRKNAAFTVILIDTTLRTTVSNFY